MTFTREQIIALAREAKVWICDEYEKYGATIHELERFAAIIEQAARADERERCAKLESEAGIYTKHDLAAAIRALKEQA